MSTAQADKLFTQQQPTVVYEGRSTISAQSYYQRLKRREETAATLVTAPDGSGILALEDNLPLFTSALRVGPPKMKAIQGLTTPLFIMGMDEVSLTWFREAALGLVDVGARGIVVQASTKAAWIDLQNRAREAGLDLMLLAGDSIARGYGISSYPIVLMDPRLVKAVAHE
jgi:integrating conjugative element protein (TIGR03765 family)